MLSQEFLGSKVKLIKKPAFVKVIVAKQSGNLQTSYGSNLQYQVNDLIISDVTGEIWPVSRTVYDKTYIDGSNFDIIGCKFIHNLANEIKELKIDQLIAKQLFLAMKANCKMEYSNGCLIGIKKFIISDAIIASEDGTVITKEGDVIFKKGDFIVTGIEGEQWPIKREKIEREYIYDNDSYQTIEKLINSYLRMP